MLFLLFLAHLTLLSVMPPTSGDNIVDDDLESLRNLILAPGSTDIVVTAAEAFQSDVCTPEDERLQHQCFSELPADNYEILEGSSVRMRCRVAWQRGKAQWRAHNALLGYDRDLRNWPKYSMKGDPEAGEHDLVISSVSREDAGNFECQVSPTVNQPLLRRSTNLTVLVPPSKPIILAPPGEPQPTKNGQLVISRPGYSIEGGSKDFTSAADDKLRLICQAKGGNPPPSLEWFHNGVPVRNRFMDDEDSNDDNYGKPSHDAEGETKLVLSKSTLVTGDRLTCLVTNKAIQRATNLGQQKPFAEIIVTVQTPPGIPVILSPDGNIIDSIEKEEDSSVHLVCQSKPPGSPPGEVLWHWEPSSAESHSGRYSKLPSLEQYSQHTANGNLLESHLMLPGVKRSENGLYIVCITRHKLGVDQKTKVLLNVKYAPAGVCIHKNEASGGGGRFAPPSNQQESPSNADCDADHPLALSRPLHVHPDRQHIFSCSSTLFYGSATIKWFGAATANDLTWFDLANFTSIAELKRVGPNGASYIKTVSLRPPTLNSARIGALQCRGYASANAATDSPTNIVDQVILKPYEAPKRPVIRVESKSNSLAGGDILKLKCEAEDGEPEGKLSWLKASRESREYTPIYLISTIEHDRHRKRMSSNLDIQLSADDHLSSYKCASSNPGFQIAEAQISAAFQVNLTFRPQHIRIDRITSPTGPPPPIDHAREPEKLITITAGDLLTLVCTAGPANPPVPLQWRQVACDQDTTPNRTTTAFSSGTSGPEKSVCRVLNNFGDAKPLPTTPSKLILRSQVSFLVQPHHHMSSVECSALDEQRKTDDQPSWSSRVNEEASCLKNEVTLNVLFKPNFSNVLSKLNSSASKYLPQYISVEGASIDLDLSPSSNPPITSAMWFHRKINGQTLAPWVEITDQLSLSTGAPARLRLPRIGVEHMGSYKVTGSNRIGTADLIFFLNVTHAPRLIGEHLVNATTKGREAELVCRVKANPPPRASSVYWRRVTDETPAAALNPYRAVGDGQHAEKPTISGLRCNQEFVAERVKYYVKCFSPEPYHMVSSLYITDVDPSDVGRYECFVDNGIGSPVVRFIDLIYPFAPRILPIDRWGRAAPPYDPPLTSFNQSQLSPLAPVPPTSVVCLIAAEPQPTVTWFREPANLTLVEGGQFKSSVTRVHAGRYRALLSIEFVRQVDLGSYFCQAKNIKGVDVRRVALGTTTPPEKPGAPFLLKATSSSFMIGWKQGFNGGPPQTFIVKWAPKESPASVQTAEVKEDLESEIRKHTIENLPKATTFRIEVSARNALHKMSSFSDILQASTRAMADPSEEAMRDEALVGREGTGDQMTGAKSVIREGGGGGAASGSTTSSPSMTMIIAIATCFGCLIFITNLILVGIVLHRRHRRRNSKLKRIPGTDSLVKCGVMDTYPTVDCYPDRFSAGHHNYGPYMDSASQKDSLSQYQFEHFGQCSPSMPAEYISSNSSYFPRDSPLNIFANSPALLSAAAAEHQAAAAAQQHRFNSQTMSRASSPLHSSRSHGFQPPTAPSSLDHQHPLHQRHLSFTTTPGAAAAYQPLDQSIYLVAAPNPHRYITDDPLGNATAAALYLNNGGMTHHPGTVSPHSLTDKSYSGVSDGRTYGSGPSRGNTVAYHHSSPRMITSFYAPPRADIMPVSSNTLASNFGHVVRRNSSLAQPEQTYAIENTTLGRSPKRPVITFANDMRNPPPPPRPPTTAGMCQVPPITDMDAVGAANDLTMTSDHVATIPPPTDFGLPPPPGQMDGPPPIDQSMRQFSTNLRQHHFGISGETGIEWLGSPGRQQQNLSTDGGQVSSFEKVGVHFDPSM